METFWLGIHHPAWLEQAVVPLFISHRVLVGRKSLPRAIGQWALDSGAFTEISLYGGWRTRVKEYVADVRRYQGEIGGLVWAAQQDWMCEPSVLSRTKLTVRAHQRLTVENMLAIRSLDAALPIIPTLQGWHPDDYERHVDQYAAAGIDLTRESLVGIGSICRRQQASESTEIVRRLASLGLRLHGFGLRVTGLRNIAEDVISADSMAWSLQARLAGVRLRDCDHRNCANCLKWAVLWRDRIVAAVWHSARQMDLFSKSHRRSAAREGEQSHASADDAFIAFVNDPEITAAYDALTRWHV